MLSVPLPQFKRRLEDMLLDLQLLATALQQLRDQLPERSEKRATVLTLIGRLNDANKKALRGTLDNAALQTEYNAIRSDLSDFIQTLEERDFEDAPPAPQEKSAHPRQGSVLYRIPHTMPLRQETTCVVRIAINENVIVEEIVVDEQVVLKDLTRVSDLMQVELSDPGRNPVFAIRSTSPPQQLITPEGYTEWFFYVEPLLEGVFPLEVKVSVLELALNQIHRKELVFRETIQIVTNQAPPMPDKAGAKSASEGSFKTAGQAFAFAGEALEPYPPTPPEQPESVEQAPPPSISNNRSVRTLALFLAFIILGSTATWAFTPADTLDWWVATIVDNEKSYENYLVDHPDSPYREKALYYRAERSQLLADLRAYQNEYGSTGKFREKIATRVDALETRALDDIKKDPQPDKIRQFAAQFPESNRLPEVKKAVEARQDRRSELMAEVEDAYLSAARTRPSEQNIKNYLDDFPKSAKLADIAQVAADNPEIHARVQPDIDAAITRNVKAAKSPEEVRNVLPAIEIAASSQAAREVENIVAQKPEWNKQNKLKQQVKQSTEKVRLREKMEASQPSRNNNPASPEERDWNKTLQINTAAEYIYFVRKYPESAHQAEARQRVKSFNLGLAEIKQLNTAAAQRLQQEAAQKK